VYRVYQVYRNPNLLKMLKNNIFVFETPEIYEVYRVFLTSTSASIAVVTQPHKVYFCYPYQKISCGGSATRKKLNALLPKPISDTITLPSITVDIIGDDVGITDVIPAFLLCSG